MESENIWAHLHTREGTEHPPPMRSHSHSPPSRLLTEQMQDSGLLSPQNLRSLPCKLSCYLQRKQKRSWSEQRVRPVSLKHTIAVILTLSPSTLKYAPDTHYQHSAQIPGACPASPSPRPSPRSFGLAAQGGGGAPLGPPAACLASSKASLKRIGTAELLMRTRPATKSVQTSCSERKTLRPRPARSRPRRRPRLLLRSGAVGSGPTDLAQRARPGSPTHRSGPGASRPLPAAGQACTARRSYLRGVVASLARRSWAAP